MDEHEADAAVSAGITPGNILNDGLVAEGGGWLYYADAYDGRKLYRVRADGSDRVRLSDDEYCVYINISGGWVYYRAGIKKSVLKIRPDGTGKIQIAKEALNIVGFNVSGGWIYYSVTGQGENKLLKIRCDGAEKRGSS